MKIRMMVAGLAALMLAGCSSMDGAGISNPFAQPSLTESYISQFRDIPIPAPMSSSIEETLVTVGTDGTKFGLESFSGRVDGISLSNVMMQNMARSGWQLRGSSVGVRSIQLYQKGQHYAALFFREGVVNTVMDIWVVNGVNVDILTLIPEAHAGTLTPPAFGTNSSSDTPSAFSDPSSDQVFKLSD